MSEVVSATKSESRVSRGIQDSQFILLPGHGVWCEKVCMCERDGKCVCMCVCMSVCMCVCMSVCMSVS